MHTERFKPPLSPQQFAALMAEAKLRATELRDAALDDVWAGLARAVRSAWHTLKPARPVPCSQHPTENRTCPR